MGTPHSPSVVWGHQPVVFSYRSQAPRNCPTERWGAPVYHGHAWVPWIKIPPGVKDFRACPPHMADLVDDLHI